MNKTALLHEAKQQQAALQQLSLWKRIAMLLSSCAAVLAWWGIAGSGLRFAGGVCGVVIALACAVCAAVIGRASATETAMSPTFCRRQSRRKRKKCDESTTISAAVHGY